MAKTIVVVGTLDTKGAEIAFVRDLVERQGLATWVIDCGVMGDPPFAPDVGSAEVARAGGGDLDHLRDGSHKDEAMQVMQRGLTAIVGRLWKERQLDGILGMGGSGGTSIATAAMRALPVGIPKVMVSAMGGGDTSAFCGTKDITFIPSVVDVAGFNRISRAIYAQGAGAIAGMVKLELPDTGIERPLVAASMVGNTTKAIDHARGLLEAAGYEVLVFPGTGIGGRTMENLIGDGLMTAALDLTITELADEICGGAYSSGRTRCQAAPRAGIPVVLSPGVADMAKFRGPENVPDRYRDRKLYHWNPNVTLLRTNVEENWRIGVMLAEAANLAPDRVAVLLPLRGLSMLGTAGGPFHDPEADHACFEGIRSRIRPDIPVQEMGVDINDPRFAEEAARILLEFLGAHGRTGSGPPDPDATLDDYGGQQLASPMCHALRSRPPRNCKEAAIVSKTLAAICVCVFVRLRRHGRSRAGGAVRVR